MSDTGPQWEVTTQPTNMKAAGCAPMLLQPGWEPFATSVSQTGKTWVWVRRPSDSSCRYCGIEPDQELPRPSFQDVRRENDRLRSALRHIAEGTA